VHQHVLTTVTVLRANAKALTHLAATSNSKFYSYFVTFVGGKLVSVAPLFMW